MSSSNFGSIPCRHLSAVATDDEDDHILPTRHSSKLPPSVCPPSLLRSEVESLFDAPIGSLIAYEPLDNKQLRSVEEEIEHAYYQSDAIVQRVEYLMRGLNAQVSSESYVNKCVEKGQMIIGDKDMGSALSRQECFRVMIDLMKRMSEEGEAFIEMRTRVRSQLEGVAEDSSDSSSSDSSSDEENDDIDEKTVKEFTQYTDERMRSAGFTSSESASLTSSTSDEDAIDDEDFKIDPDDYQFGAAPGVTVHMYDLLLDSLACLCKEQYSSNGPSDIDLIEVLKGLSPPEFARDILDEILNTHWMDGGDIGLGSAADASNALNKIAQGIGIGAGTGAGTLAHYTAMNFDVRTCPTPMTFNAVIRVAAEFDHKAHASMVQEAEILSGSVVATSKEDEKNLKMEQDRLRDITIDTAFSSYTRMKHTAAMTLRSIKSSTKNATSRSALKRQAKMLETGKPSKRSKEIISGRNTATYNYLIQTVKKCLPASISRGNVSFGLYHKACVQEGVMDESLVKTMMALGGYDPDLSGSDATAPPVSNGPLFDQFMQQELGNGAKLALENGRQRRHDRNYKMRRHVEWDDTY